MYKFPFLILVFFLTACVSPEQREWRSELIKSAWNDVYLATSNAQELNCKTKEKCDKLFRIASDVVTDMSSMKVQSSTSNYISTFNPINVGHIGMTARRTLITGSEERVTLIINCRGMNKDTNYMECLDRVATIYNVYKKKVDWEHLLE